MIINAIIYLQMDHNLEMLLDGLGQRQKDETTRSGSPPPLIDTVRRLNSDVQNSDRELSNDYLNAVKLITEIVNKNSEITLEELKNELENLED